MSKTTFVVAGVAAALVYSAGTNAQGPSGQGQRGQGQQGAQEAPSSAGGDQKSKAPQRQNSGDQSGPARAQKSDDAKSPARQQKADDQGKAPARQQKADDQGKAPARQQKADDQGKAPARQQKADDQGKSPARQQKAEERTRDRQQKEGTAKGQNTKQQKSADDANQPKDGKAGTAQKSGDQDGADRKSAGSGEQATPRRAEINTEQRSNLRQSIVRNQSVNRVTNVRVDINVGTRVPRDIRLAALPASAISIVPAYRSYRYFVVEDRIVIVDPVTYVIVEVIDDGGPGDRDGGARLVLTDAEREILLREIEIDSASTLGIGSLTIGAEVPRAARVRALPDRVASDLPKIRNYRYFTAENRIVLVAPNDDRVVFVVEGRR
jgi:hypothetical protein